MSRPKPQRSLIPAIAARSATPTEIIATREAADRAVDAFVEQLGGKDKVIAILEVGAQDPQVRGVLELIADPRHERTNLTALCRLSGLTIADLFGAFRTSAMIGAQIVATERIAAGIIPVVEDVLRRAAPYEDTCEVCQGTGSVTPEPTKKIPNPDPEPCKTCRATGLVKCLPDLERQKLALDLAELVKKSGGIAINNQQLNVQAPAAGGTLERMQQAMAGMLAAPLVLDVESTPSQAE